MWEGLLENFGEYVKFLYVMKNEDVLDENLDYFKKIIGSWCKFRKSRWRMKVSLFLWILLECLILSKSLLWEIV